MNKIDNLLYEECKKLYLSGMSLLEIGKRKNINRHSLKKLLNKDNIIIRSKAAYHMKYDKLQEYKFDEHYFDNIDSEEKAYTLGIIYGCGEFSKNTIYIHSSEKDQELIQKISNIIYGKDNSTIEYHPRKNKLPLKFIYLKFNSKYLVDHFTKLNINQSRKKLEFPEWLDENYYRCFIKGLVDINGWISPTLDIRSSPSIGLVLSNSIVNKLKIILKDINILCINNAELHFNQEIKIKNYIQVITFLDWIYEDSKIHNERKYKLYQQIKQQYKDIQEKKITTEKFIDKANEVHNCKYDYSLVNYVATHNKVIIICKSHGQFKQTPSGHLAGKGCAYCTSSISRIETQWLDSLNISKDCRQKCIFINNKKYMPDAYDSIINTIYEFYGDFWHGNPELYNLDLINGKVKKTFRELYNKTIEKEQIYKDAGYNVISIWENDFKKSIYYNPSCLGTSNIFLYSDLYRECKRLYLMGLSLTKICKDINISRQTLSKCLRCDGVNIVKKNAMQIKKIASLRRDI